MLPVVEQLLQISYNLFKTSSTPDKKKRNSMESQLVGRSPITLALMNNGFEIDFINEIEGKKLNHMRLVEELKTFEISFQQSEQTDDITEGFRVEKNMLEEAVATSEADIQRFYIDGQANADQVITGTLL
jgi:hypothetical protein